MSDKLERSQLQAWIYEFLKQGKSGSLDLQLNDIALSVRGKSVAAGTLESRPFEGNYRIPQEIV